jgi:hypothetical protein
MRTITLIIAFNLLNFLYSAEKPLVHLVTYSSYLLPDQGPISYERIQKDFNLQTYVGLYRYVNSFKGDSPDLRKIVFLDYCEDPKTYTLPKYKTVCFKWEAIKILPKFYEPYIRVYTFDDDLVDNQKFFKFHYPVLQPMIQDVPSFNQKKFLVMVVGNWLQERQDIARYFINKNPGLEVYGSRMPGTQPTDPYYQGRIKGYYSSNEKLKTLSAYKFCICFENTHTTPGYITEKIFDCFAGGCIPIYWGPDNVTEYIPSDCFIDYRNFHSYNDLYLFLRSMTEKEYDEYFRNIRDFLNSDEAQLFSKECFEELLYTELSTP